MPNHDISRPRLAVCLDDLKLEIREALDVSRRLGFRTLDVCALRGPVSPDEMSRSAQRHFKKHLDDLGLRLSSLRGPHGGSGYDDPATGDRRLDAMRRIIALASEMRVPAVSTLLGPVSNTSDSKVAPRIRETLSILAEDADRLGVTVAIETSGLTTTALRDLLADINCPALMACCDTGAMLMQGEDPHRVAELLGGRIGLTRTRDAVAGSPGAMGHEVAMGEGQLSPPALLAALVEAGFTGDMILTRTGGSSVAQDLIRARQAFESPL